MYNKIDNEVLKELRGILGEGDLLTPEDDLDAYAHDEVAELWHAPEAVARVRTTEQVSQILELAQTRRFPVTPRGAGQGLSGGAVPVFGGLVLSLEAPCDP